MEFFIRHQFRRICYPPAWSMRIYYPTNKEEPTPALPKGGSLTPTPTPSPREGGKGQAPTRSGGYVIRLNKREPCIRGALSPSLGEGWGGLPPPSSLEVAPQALAD